jgi:phosphoribosylanthranilate isomerase
MVFQAFPAGAPEVAHADDWGADAILLDAPNAGSGLVFDWSLAADVPSSQRVIVAGGLDPTNVAAAISTIRPWGVDVATGVEAAPGQKDAIKLRDFIREARGAFGLLEDDAMFLRGSDLEGEDLPYDWEEEA